MHRHRFALAASILFPLTAGSVAACGDDEEAGGGSTAAPLVLEGQTELFPGLDYSTGLQPPGSPVQASFSVTAAGVGKVRAEVVASGSSSSPTLTGVPGTGSLAIEGGFGLNGQLVVDISGLPSYDGPIPGIENVNIPIQGSATFDPFSIGAPTPSRADIPPADLPGIPLPGGIPGQLVLKVAAGSFVEVSFAGTCAGIDGGEATYSGTLARSGTLVIEPNIEIEVPILGTQSYAIPSFTVDLASALGSTEVVMTAPVKSYGAKPGSGDHVTGSCSPGTGGAGAGGGGVGGGAVGGSGAGGVGAGGGGPEPPCASEPTYQDCLGCFAAEQPAGYNDFANAYINQCLCANECAAACTADCVDPNVVTPGCESCLGNLPGGSGCATGLADECAASGAACTQFYNDVAQYCSGKP